MNARVATMRRALDHHDHALHASAETRALLRAIGLVFQAGASGKSVDATMRSRLRADDHETPATRSLLALVSRAVQDPATTDVDAWAGELVQTVVADLLDVLAAQGNAVAQLPFARFTLDGRALRVPLRVAGSSSLSGAFRAEGGAIRVGAMSLTSIPLTGKSLAVIGTSISEMIGAAGDDVMLQVMRSGMLADSSATLDSLFFDDEPATDVRPPGLASLATGSNTAASTGTTVAAISADLKARLTQLVGNGFGSPSTRWVMNTIQAGTMFELFAEVQTRGTFLNIPIVSGPSVPIGTVFLIDCAGVVLGADSPVFDSTSETVLHEEDDPVAVADDVTAGTPVRSLFQTNATALRMVWPMDWAGAAGAIQTVTGASW